MCRVLWESTETCMHSYMHIRIRCIYENPNTRYFEVTMRKCSATPRKRTN